MTDNRLRPIVNVTMILKKDDTFLLGKRINTGWMDGLYAVVGGTLEAGETIVQALVREVREEVGIEVNLVDVRLVHVIHCMTRIIFFMEVDKWNGEPCNMESEKCAELIWVTKEAFPPNILPFLKGVIEKIEQGIMYSEYGWE